MSVVLNQKTNLASLKNEVNKIDTDKLKTVPVDLAKLSNVVKIDVVKKTEYNSLKLILETLFQELNIKKMDQILQIKSAR